jgi:hypothetical protein
MSTCLGLTESPESLRRDVVRGLSRFPGRLPDNRHWQRRKHLTGLFPPHMTVQESNDFTCPVRRPVTQSTVALSAIREEWLSVVGHVESVPFEDVLVSLSPGEKGRSGSRVEQLRTNSIMEGVSV